MGITLSIWDSIFLAYLVGFSFFFGVTITIWLVKPKNLANQKKYTELLIFLNHMINNAEGKAKDDLTALRTALVYNKSILELRND